MHTVQESELTFVISSDEPQNIFMSQHNCLVDFWFPEPRLLVPCWKYFNRHIFSPPLSTPHLAIAALANQLQERNLCQIPRYGFRPRNKNITIDTCLAMLLCTSKGSPEPDPLQVISNISFIVVVWLSSRKPVELADFVEDRSMTTVFWMGLSTICPNRLPRLAKLPTLAWCVTPYLISGDLATLSVYQYY